MSEIKTLSFQTSLYYKDLQLSSELEQYCKQAKLDTVPNEHSSSFWINNESLAKLIVPDVKDFFIEVGQAIGYKEFALQHTWIQHYSFGQNHRVHIHSVNPNDYSFVYYIECDDTSAHTVFYNIGYPYIDHGAHKIKPVKGRCVLFPGAMPHEAQSNPEETRLVVSGNVSFT